MAETHIRQDQTDYYTQNSDWNGRMLEHEHEIVKYRNDSVVRIWYNEQTTNYDPHWHTALEVIMPVENYYDVLSGSQHYHVMPGDILVISPGETHHLVAPESGKRFIFLFDISMISNLKSFAGIHALLHGCIHITRSAFPQIYDEVYALFMLMRNEYFSLDEFRELSICSHLLNFFVVYGKNYLTNTELLSNVKVYKQKEYMQKFNTVLDYIDSHYMEELTLDDIADFSGFSKYHFTRLFKRYTDATFYEYLSIKRIKSVEKLLAESDLSITEIALQSGFSSISTFNRIFKQQKQCTPSEFRTLCNEIQFASKEAPSTA